MQLDEGTVIGIVGILLAIGGFIYSAGVQGAEIRQNTKDISDMKAARDVENAHKAQSQIQYENRLTAIEIGIKHMVEKIDMFLEFLKK